MFGRLDDASAVVSAPPRSGLDAAGVHTHSGGLLAREGDGSARGRLSTLTRPSGATGGSVDSGGGYRRRREPAWTTRYVARLVGLDLIVALVSIVTTGQLVAAGIWGNDAGVQWFVAVLIVLWPLGIAANHGYDRSRLGVGHSEMSSVLRSAGVLMVLTTFVDTFVLQGVLIKLVVVAVPMAALLSLTTRYLTRKALHRRQADGRDLRRVLLVGPAALVNELNHQLSLEAHHGLQVLGVCVPEQDADLAHLLGLTVVGNAEDTALVASNLDCDTVAVTGGNPSGFLRQLAWSLEGARIDLLVHPGLVEVAGPRMHIRQHIGLPLLHVEEPHFTGWRRVVKRAFDLTATTFGLLLISPIVVGIATAIKLGDGGPVFFRQTRVGIDGSTFTMYKFRSMVVDAEARKAALASDNEGAGLLFKMKHDPRVTRVGRLLRAYSLDELPQLINVVLGQMSLVGPRPPLPDEAAGYNSEVRRRLLVKPGLTGLWQVSGRSLLSWEESVRLDLRYVENWSLTMDLLLLWKTVWAVLAKRGAF